MLRYPTTMLGYAVTTLRYPETMPRYRVTMITHPVTILRYPVTRLRYGIRKTGTRYSSGHEYVVLAKAVESGERIGGGRLHRTCLNDQRTSGSTQLCRQCSTYCILAPNHIPSAFRSFTAALTGIVSTHKAQRRPASRVLRSTHFSE